MSSSNSGAGTGCLGLVVMLVVVSWVIQHLLQVLAVLGLTAAAWLVAWGAVRAWQTAAERAAQRRRCPVCQGWSASVLLTDLDADAEKALCPDHGARYGRICALEERLRLPAP